jgi:hypothetical protein
MSDKKEKSCKECKFHRSAGKVNQFKCSWNNKFYKSTKICFGFKDKNEK